jgi:hypothetical protein
VKVLQHSCWKQKKGITKTIIKLLELFKHNTRTVT